MRSSKLFMKFKIELHTDRLERLSADSHWAHQACGLRGSLLRLLSEMDNQTPCDDFSRLEELVKRGFDILTLAAKEIPEGEYNNKS